MIHVASGWDVYNAVNVHIRSGKLAVFPAGSYGFMWDVVPGYPNWGYTQNTVTANEALARAMLTWLTGKTSGMSVLRFGYNGGVTAFGPTGFGNFVSRSNSTGPTFDDAWGNIYGWGPWASSVGLSGTYTNAITTSGGSGPGWASDHDWEGHDPYSYDVVCFSGTPHSTNYSKVDAYLQSGHAVVAPLWDSTTWSRYGAIGGTGYQPGAAPPDYMRPAFSCSPFGAGTFQYGVYSSPYVKLGTNTQGGSAETYPNGSGNDAVLLWTA
jgi:hypothetical protein